VSVRTRKVTAAIRNFIDDVMQDNDETTLGQLREQVNEKFNVLLSKSAIDKTRRSLGWTFKSAAYCQVVREANRIKRLNFALEHPNLAQTCGDMIFTDETSCELQCHRLRCGRKKGQPPKKKPRPKHPVKVSDHYFIHCSLYINSIQSWSFIGYFYLNLPLLSIQVIIT
jgi:hypothetical protein